MSRTIELTGESLSLDDVWDVAVHGAKATLSPLAHDRMRLARELLESIQGEHTYGVNTGFGRFVSARIPDELAEELQVRLLRSHACGVGEPYPDDVVRAALLLRANALAKGYSGARVETVELALECLNRGVLPVVPSQGSVGASGDLAPLAHLALPLIGEGEAWVDGVRLDGDAALGRVGLEPITLAPKEGLSLVNGTQFMSAMAALGVVRARRLAKTADLACALSLEALRGSRTSFQAAVLDSTADRLSVGLKLFKARFGVPQALVAAGGVAANQAIRAALQAVAEAAQTTLIMPPPALCTDNGAMIAWAGAERLVLGMIDGMDAAPRARWLLDAAATAPAGYANTRAGF